MKGDDPILAINSCLDRTRSAVLNVLIAMGAGIALSGWLLRSRDRFGVINVQNPVINTLLFSLGAVAAASHVYRRWSCGIGSLNDPATRSRRFFRGHVVSASTGLLAIPLGLAYGWLARPTLDAVAPFWIVGLAIGFLSLPRRAELEGFDDPSIDQRPAFPESESDPSEPIIS